MEERLTGVDGRYRQLDSHFHDGADGLVSAAGGTEGEDLTARVAYWYLELVIRVSGGHGGGTRSRLFVVISSHAAHVSSTPTIITLNDRATFSNVHVDKVWRPYDRLKYSAEDPRN